MLSIRARDISPIPIFNKKYPILFGNQTIIKVNRHWNEL